MNQDKIYKNLPIHDEDEQEPDCLHVWGHKWESKFQTYIGKDVKKETECCPRCDLHRRRIISKQIASTITHGWKYYGIDKYGKERQCWRVSHKYWTQCFISRTIKDWTGEWDFIHHPNETIDDILRDTQIITEIQQRNGFINFSNFTYFGNIASNTKNVYIKFEIKRKDMDLKIFIIK